MACVQVQVQAACGDDIKTQNKPAETGNKAHGLKSLNGKASQETKTWPSRQSRATERWQI